MTISGRLGAALVLGVGVLSSCYGEVLVDDVDSAYYPPPAYVATTPPVYYGGYPSYWYGGRWYRRDGPHWRAYRGEPQYLRDYRVRTPPPRAYYGRTHFARPPGHHR